MYHKITRSGQIHYAVLAALYKKLHYRRLLVGGYLIVVGLLFYLDIIKLEGALVGPHLAVSIGLTMILYGITSVSRVIISLRRFLNAYRKLYYDNTIEVEISRDKISFENGLLTESYKWEFFKSFRVTKTSIYIYPNIKMFLGIFILKIELSETELIALIRLLKDNGIVQK